MTTVQFSAWGTLVALKISKTPGTSNSVRLSSIIAMQKILLKLLYYPLRWGYHSNLLQIYEGIRICDSVDSDPIKRERNRRHFIQALEIIRAKDPKRFHRIQKRIDYIVNGVCLGAGEYHHALKVCYVDLKQFDLTTGKNENISQLARTLVHEATHGEIEAHGIKYNKSNGLRIERLCHREEMRFLARHMPEARYEDFNPAWWEDSLKQSAWQRIERVRERLNETDT